MYFVVYYYYYYQNNFVYTISNLPVKRLTLDCLRYCNQDHALLGQGDRVELRSMCFSANATDLTMMFLPVP